MIGHTPGHTEYHLMHSGPGQGFFEYRQLHESWSQSVVHSATVMSIYLRMHTCLQTGIVP